MVFSWDKLIELLRLDLDPIAINMLKQVALYEPISIYRLARNLNVYFSYAYRKFKTLEDDALVRGSISGRAKVYSITPRGLITCLAYNCIEENIIMSKLLKKWNLLNRFSPEELSSFLKLYFQIYEYGAPLDDVNLMGLYTLHKCRGEVESCLNGVDWRTKVVGSRVIAYAFFYALRLLLRNKAFVFNDDFMALVEQQNGDFKIIATECRLCGREKYCIYDTCPTLKEYITKSNNTKIFKLKVL